MGYFGSVSHRVDIKLAISATTSFSSAPVGPFAQFISPLEVLIPIDSTSNDPFSQGIVAYSNGDYQLAIASLEQAVYPVTPPYAKLYLGVSQLLHGQAPAAIETFENMQRLNTAGLDHALNWYLALAYLEDEQEHKAIPLLEQLKTHISYSKSAEQILLELQD